MMDSVLEKLVDRSRFVCNLDIAAVHTTCVNGAQESAPVTQIPERFVTVSGTDGARQPAIDSIHALVAECFEKNQLFSETGIPWSRSGKVIDIGNYRSFPSGDALPA